ncbi:MAG: SagB/ThcOx family dehydrogenase [Proteobacteria bacterium]|nr:SagB/ThcOx family dehydrogenase [Pseudomonadota bacterium]
MPTAKSSVDSVAQVAAVKAYHKLTKHLPTRYAPGPDGLDWANQPDPFRRWAGSRIVELPFVAKAPTIPFAKIHDPGATEPAVLGLENIGLFLELALGLSAWKQYGETRWSLRTNPSSGNLHPTEGYVLLPPLDGVSDHPAVFHYAPRDHALEERGILTDTIWETLPCSGVAGCFLVGLSSVHWREAWKYGERAFRYCQHDVGHALGSLRFAAAALGWRLKHLSALSDSDVAALLGLDRNADFQGSEAEHPDLVALVSAEPREIVDPRPEPAAIAGVRNCDWRGHANILSPDHVPWPEIDWVAEATFKPRTRPPNESISLPPPAVSRLEREHSSSVSIGSIIRRRRSAVAMDGRTSISLDVFLRLLWRTMPLQNAVPWDAFELPPRIHLAIFVHRVDDLAPGLYVLMRDPSRQGALQEACRVNLIWKPVTEDGLPFFALDLADLREVASYTSCMQDIAGDGCFSLGMIADFRRTLDEEGPWAYRRLFWESGLIGQVLYLEAEAAGVQATGIGCYFDDLMHQGLGLDPGDDTWQSLYHFTVGGGVTDTRLTTLPPYGHLPMNRRP